MTPTYILNVVSLVGLTIVLGGVYSSWHAWFAFASRRWPSVPGRVLRSGVEAFEGIPPVYRAYIRYQYTVDGVTLESTRLRFGAVNCFSHLMVTSELARAGAVTGDVRVHYDTQNPKRACLTTGPNEWTLSLPIILLLSGAAVLALGIYPFIM